MLIPTLLLAATVSLSSEVPLGTPSPQAAGGFQSLTSAASNGHDFLAAWDDQRNAPLGPFTTWGGRIDATGTPLEPTGHNLGATGVVMWSGSSYLFVTPTAAQPLDENGRPSGDPIPLHLTVTPSEVTSNATTMLALSNAGFNVVGRDGRILADQGFGGVVRISKPFVLPNDDYAFVMTALQCDPGPCMAPVELVVINGASGVAKYTPLTDIGNPAYGAAASITSNDNVLVSWVEESGAVIAAKYELVDANGHTVVPPATINTASFLYAQQPVVGWDGNEFLVLIAWTPPSGLNPTLHAYRISATGTLLDSSDGFVLTSTFWQHARIAHAANAVLVAWDEFSGLDVDVVGRVASSFDGIERADTNVLAMSAQTELRPRLADGGAFAIWSQPAIGELHEQPVGGREDVVTNSMLSVGASVARGTSCYLIAWTSLDSKEFVAIINVKRVTLDGTLIDPNPIVVAKVPLLDASNVPPPAVAFDGANFFVVFPTDYDMQGVRVAQSGALVDAAPIAVSSLGPHSGTAIAPRVVWDGTQYVVGWIDSLFLNSLISPVPPIPDFIRLVRVKADGTVLDPKTIAVWNSGDAQSLALAANANGVTAMWVGYPDTAFKQICLWAAQLGHDGTVVTPARELFCNTAAFPSTLNDVDLAWSGTEFVAVWNDAVAADIKAQRFGTALLPLDTQPFEVSPSGARAMQPSIASSSKGTTIAYVRVGNEPQFGGVPRAFVRTLLRIGASWPRAAKH